VTATDKHTVPLNAELGAQVYINSSAVYTYGYIIKPLCGHHTSSERRSGRSKLKYLHRDYKQLLVQLLMYRVGMQYITGCIQ